MTGRERRELRRQQLRNLAADLWVYTVAGIGAFGSRYIDDYFARVEFHFDLSWEVLIITGILGIVAAGWSDKALEKLALEAKIKKRLNWRARARNALAYGVMVDAILGKVLGQFVL